ncbi:hypothetical protein C8R44DRAFT_875708 [Mycena epipterygia]|nr:hypothetical protein C8R44DRAFT_875708 [Mycena epipterygia]
MPFADAESQLFLCGVMNQRPAPEVPEERWICSRCVRVFVASLCSFSLNLSRHAVLQEWKPPDRQLRRNLLQYLREPAIVQDDLPQEIAPQIDNSPQQVQSVAPPSTSTLQLASGTTSQSVRVDRASTPPLGLSASFESSPSISSIAVLSTASPISSLLSSTISAASSSLPISSSLVPSSSPTSSWSSITPSSSSSSTSSSSPAAASPAALYHPSASMSLAALRRPSTLTHGAPLYAAVALGALILLAFLTALTALLIRARLRARRRAAALTNIAWDPVVLADAKPHANNSNGNGNKLAGDRDVGEPKRSESFVSRRGSSASYASFYHPSAYHHQQQQPQHPTTLAWPTHCHPCLRLCPRWRAGTAKGVPDDAPAPAYLADRDPHRFSIDNANIDNHDANGRRSTTRSVASSRTGSLRSHLQSASMLGRCVSVHSAPASTEVAKYSSTADSTRCLPLLCYNRTT